MDKLSKISKKNWIAFWIIVLCQIFTLILRFNFMNIPMTLLKSLFQLCGIPIFYLYTHSYISGLSLALSILNGLITLLLIRYFLKEPFETYGFHFRLFRVQLLCGIVLAFILVGLRGIMVSPLFALPDHFKELISLQTVFLFFSALIYASYEEILYRGFALTFFQRLFKNPMSSVFLSAILFGIMHYPSEHSMEHVIYTFCFGVTLGYLRIKSPEKFTIYSLSLAHGFHNFMWDLLQYLLQFSFGV